jgi:hypothetical protein
MQSLNDHARVLLWAGLVSTAVGLTACNSGGSDDDNVQAQPPQSSLPDPGAVDVANAGRCSILDARYCLFPWPSDHYTRADNASDTGQRVDIAQTSLPSNRDDQPIDPGEWNRNDGFSANQTLMTRVPGLDLARTGAVRITDLSASKAADAPIMVIDALSGEKQLVWAELDANAQADTDRALLIRPAKRLAEGRRYIAVLRNLRDTNGDALIASDAFRIYRDQIATDRPAIEARRDDMAALFDTLDTHGVERDDLYLAWDFTVAS